MIGMAIEYNKRRGGARKEIRTGFTLASSKAHFAKIGMVTDL